MLLSEYLLAISFHSSQYVVAVWYFATAVYHVLGRRVALEEGLADRELGCAECKALCFVVFSSRSIVPTTVRTESGTQTRVSESNGSPIGSHILIEH